LGFDIVMYGRSCRLLFFFLYAAGTFVYGEPETYLTAPELIKYWGYPAETHEAVTDDGYILGLHRIPHGRNEAGRGESKREVFLVQHALLSSSADWVINLPQQSLGFMLADHGYDVWLGNVRGNTYSKKHTSLNVEKKSFWDFSLDEHAKYDLPAMIDYILKNTGQQQLNYVGYSQGSMMAFAGFSENIHLQRKIKKFFSLAPPSRLSNINLVAKSMAFWAPTSRWVFDMFGIYEFYPSSDWMNEVQKRLCWWVPFMCTSVMAILTSDVTINVNQTRIPVYLAHTPAGTSVKNFNHFAQLINSERFQKYDYGAYGNFKRYKSTVPPEYDLSKTYVPTFVMSGVRDTLCPPEDVSWTVGQLPNVVKHVVIRDYNHLDFMWAMDASVEVNMRIIRHAEGLA